MRPIAETVHKLGPIHNNCVIMDQYVPKVTDKPNLKAWCTPNTPCHTQNVTHSVQKIRLCVTPSAYCLTYA